MHLQDADFIGSLEDTFIDDDRGKNEIQRMIRLMSLLALAEDPPDPEGMMPAYPNLKQRFVDAVSTRDPDKIEDSFLELYCHLHGYEAPYTSEERDQVNKTGGYWCHAGGLSPILKAGDWIHPETVSADFGAGNGLQGLLFQWLYPHKLTRQIEISSRMVEQGKRLQKWLGIDEDRVEWIVGDVMETSPANIDFIYLYRPLKPVGPGRLFYQSFAADLALTEGEVVIFSIADCLRDFLDPTFKVFYTDGHLTCFHRKV